MDISEKETYKYPKHQIPYLYLYYIVLYFQFFINILIHITDY